MAKTHSTVIHLDFQGIAYDFTDDGWFNATIAATRYGKEPYEWLRLPATQEYLAALERRTGKIPYVKTSRARSDRGGGTWLHPKLAVRFTQWLDVDFAIWCDEQIDSLIRGTHPSCERKQARIEGRVARRTVTDTQKKFIEYAESQGSKNAKCYWPNFVRMTNAELGLPQEKGVRDTLDSKQLTNLATAEYLEAEAIDLGMLDKLDYHDIFKAAKHRVKELAAVLSKQPAKKQAGG